MKQNSGSHTEIRRYLTVEEAHNDGAYNIMPLVFPPDIWGTKASLYTGTVKVRNSDGKTIS